MNFMPFDNYELIVWLETHVRIKTKTKLFCSCKNALELASEPNINTCSVCSWQPWMLPTLNKKAVEFWVLAGHLMQCEINKYSRFDRKSYFYPDLPNSYQITQLYHPIVWAWKIKTIVNWEEKEFWIHHMHLENDAWKLTHSWWKTLCDYNRAGAPLMEIVTDPDFRSTDDVLEFLKELQKLMRAWWVSDADMEKGQMRCDVNISVRKKWETELRNRVEIKNMNSFSAIWRAIENEVKRQIKLYEAWEEVDQETRWWDDDKWISVSQRSKEDAMDYRYFPDPDLLPIVLEDDFIEELKQKVPELPIEKRLRYLNDFKLWEDDARILTADFKLSNYFDELEKLTKDAKKSCSYITTILLALIKEDEEISWVADLKFDIKELARVIELVNKDELSSTNSKEVIAKMFTSWGEADKIVDELWVRQTNDLWALEDVANQVISSFSEQVEDYKSWNEKVFGFLVGQCMKLSKWQWNPKIFNELLKNKLK